MDLSEFQVVSDSPVFFQLTNPRTGKLMEDENGPVGVEIWGRDSEAFKAVNRRAINDSIESALIEEEGKPKLDATLGAKVEEKSLDVLKACIHKFVNIKIGGKELVAPDDTQEFLTKLPWAKDQIDRAIADRKRFMVASQKGS